jgi:tetratricopeptide (TPR) repeat protein
MNKKVTNSNKKNTSNSKKIHLIIIAALIIVLYGNTLFNKYSLDDDFVVYKNETIKKGVKAIPEIFTSYYATGKANYDYRPIVKTTFAVEQQIWGDNPFFSHLLNIIIYFFICYLLYTLFRKLLTDYDPLFILLAVIIFAAHPIHTEVVASLKNRDELLSFMFSLLTLKYFMKYFETEKWENIFIGILFFILAILSKSSAFVFAMIIPVTAYFFKKVKLQKLVLLFIILMAVYFITKTVPKLYLPQSSRIVQLFENPLYFEHNIFSRIPSGVIGLIYYLKLLIFPHPLVFYYGYNMIPLGGWGSPLFIFSFLIHLSLFAISIYLIKKKPLLSYSILFYLIAIAMFSNIFKPVPGIIAERFAFAASFGFCIAISYLIFMVLKIKPEENKLRSKIGAKLIVVLMLIIIPYAAKTISRNADWKDHKALYENDIKYLKNSAKGNNLYASIIVEDAYKKENASNRQALVNKAIKHFARATEIYPEYSVAWNNLGTMYFNFYRQYDKSIFYFQKATETDTNYYEAYFNLGNAYDKTGNTLMAMKFFQKAIEKNYKFFIAYTYLSGVYFKLGYIKQAIQINEIVKEIDPNTDVSYVNLANFFLRSGDTIQAIKNAEKAVDLNSGNQKIASWLYNYYSAKGNQTRAQYYLNFASPKAKNN